MGVTHENCERKEDEGSLLLEGGGGSLASFRAGGECLTRTVSLLLLEVDNKLRMVREEGGLVTLDE